MKRVVKKITVLLLAAVMGISLLLPVSAQTILYEYPAAEEEGDTIVSPSALMMYMGVKADQDVMLYEKQADIPYQPGALMRVAMIGYAMKLITDNHIDMDEATGSYSLQLFNHYVAGTGLHVAMMDFGETWTLRDLLTVCTIQTAADCAVTLATVLSGSPEQFVEGLNGFAQELGCTNSHFTNVIGLNEEGQYMSARDVMTFTRYAMEYPELQKMLELTQYTVKPVSGGKTRSWPSSNDMVRQSSPYFYTYAVGGKTGGTLTESSMVAYGSKDGYEYMAVVMGAPRKDEKGNLTGTGYADARRLIRWGLIGFTYEMLARKNEPVGRIDVEDCAQKSSISLVPVEDFPTVVAEDLDLNTVTRRVVCETDALIAPVEQGQHVGTLELYYGEELLGQVELVAGESASYSFLYAAWRDVRAFLFSGWFAAILVVLLLLGVGYVVLNIRYNRKRKKKWK